MLLTEVIDLLGCQIIWGGELVQGLQVASCFAADLMSEVLAFSTPDALLITGLANVQSVHTAHVADLPVILFVNGKTPGQQVLDLARERGIPLLSTKLTMFAACGVLHANGLKAATKP